MTGIRGREHIVSRQMADGRELLYVDERALEHGAADERLLPSPPPASQLRYDPLLDEWVAIAAHRQERTFLPPADQCPLCPSAPGMATEIPTDYDVVVFENRFPSFSAREPWSDQAHLPQWNPVLPARGRCEVVCFTRDHDASFASLPPSRVRTVLDVLAERTEALSGLPDVEQVFCFENRGVEIGVTLHHPHGQIYAYPFVTPRTRTLLASARRHATATGGRSLFGDLLAAERDSGERVVLANEHWTAFVPAAARWPFEVFVAPHRQLPDLGSLSEVERDSFGPLYVDLLQRFDLLFGAPMPYVSAWHQAPVRSDRELTYLHLQLFSVRRAPGKLKFLAGSESAMGVFVNDVVPEAAAQMLRDAAP